MVDAEGENPVDDNKTEKESQRASPTILPLVDNVSCSGSKTSGSMVSRSSQRALLSLRMAEFRANQLETKLKLRADKLKMENEECRVDARTEIGLAKLKLTFVEDEEEREFEGVEPPANELADVKLSRVENYIENCRERNQRDSELIPIVAASTQRNPELIPVVAERLDLPKVELGFFDGNPENYWRFVRQFEFYIENRVADSGQRLLFLIHYCRGQAKVAIQDCVMLPPIRAYERARKILKDLYGQDHLVSRSLIDGLLKNLRIVSDASSLTDLSTRMIGCATALEQMEHMTDLDSITVIEQIVRTLPVHLQRGWAREVNRTMPTSKRVTFNDLQSFIQLEACLARSKFGMIAAESERIKNRPTPTQHFARRDNGKVGSPYMVHQTSIAERSHPSRNCPQCANQHQLVDCSAFLALTVNERWQALKRFRGCFGCLTDGHQLRNCTTQRACGINTCERLHHVLLHFEKPTVRSQPEKSVHCGATAVSNRGVCLGVLPVRIEGPQGSVTTYALLDNGSEVTLIQRDILQSVGVETSETSLNIRTVNGSSQITSGIARCKITSLDRSESVQVVQGFAVDRLAIRTINTDRSMTAGQWPHLSDIVFEEIPDQNIGILVGADIPEAHWTLEQRLGARMQPYAVKTLLGWVMHGPTAASTPEYQSISVNSIQVDISEQLRLLYNSEFGDTQTLGSEPSMEDKAAMKIAEETIRLVDGHFEVALPWRDHLKRCPDSREMAMCRLRGLRKRFQRDPNLFERYTAVIKSNVKKGYATVVPDEQLLPSFMPRWYIPHHAVINSKKPEKLRVVFDCAAKCNGLSLNDQLLQGPDSVASLVNILMRFRREKIAIAADVEEMFMQVRVPVHDRGALRFLWWVDSDPEKDLIEYQMTAHPFGATSSPFIASFALRHTARAVGNAYTQFVLDAIHNNFYVDDCLISFSNLSDSTTFVKQIRELLLRGGFKLRKWISNCRELLDHIPIEDRAKQVTNIDVTAGKPDRTLGLEWNSMEDVFRFPFCPIEKPRTRRGLLSIVASLYDPLGLVTPMLLPAKILLQKLCRDKLDWDDPISKIDEEAWRSWSNHMGLLDNLKIPRCLKRDGKHNSRPQLHVFCDASEKGYGAVVYSRFTPESETPYCSLIVAKSRVAPIKSVTIPRLELAAAKLGACLSEEAKSGTSIEFEKSYFWTDSTIVLHYINNTSTRFSTFVDNRLATISQFSTPSQWRHVKSEDNPADYASRGIQRQEDMSRWLFGPDFLRLDESRWPVGYNNIEVPYGVELKKPSAAVNIIECEPDSGNLLRRFSSWTKLLKTVGWLTRYKSYVISKIKGKELVTCRGPLRITDMNDAEHCVIRLVQREQYAQQTTNHDGDIARPSNVPSQLRKLCPIIINGLICVGGRLNYATHPSVVKHPPILPKRHEVTESIIRYYHSIEGHSGASQVLSAIRKKFWIVNGCSAVKRVIGACVTCRRQSAQRCQQLMSPLPIPRAESGWYPFCHVGVDYFGPFLVKRGRGTEKRYGCVFSCLQTRAVHLEVAHSLSTDSFISVLLRFIGRRGCPNDIYSDNGTNFVGAHRELRENLKQWNEKKIDDILITRGIQWHFQPPSSSHRGGIWERIIRSVRRIMNSVGNEQPMTDEVLVTLMVEVERILNDRPLVAVTSDVRDEQVLTPNHLILLKGNSITLPKEDLQTNYSKGWRQVTHLATVFWRRWLSEYLPTLQCRSKWCEPKRNLKEGDIVIIASESLPRGKWPLGVVVQGYESKDGLVRQVSVRTEKGVVRRDIRSLSRLEGDEVTEPEVTQ